MFLIRFLVQCGKCKKQVVLITLPDSSDHRGYVPTLPDGWKEAGGKFYCDGHVVTTTITIDGLTCA